MSTIENQLKNVDKQIKATKQRLKQYPNDPHLKMVLLGFEIHKTNLKKRSNYLKGLEHRNYNINDYFQTELDI